MPTKHADNIIARKLYVKFIMPAVQHLPSSIYLQSAFTTPCRSGKHALSICLQFNAQALQSYEINIYIVGFIYVCVHACLGIISPSVSSSDTPDRSKNWSIIQIQIIAHAHCKPTLFYTPQYGMALRLQVPLYCHIILKIQISNLSMDLFFSKM